MRQTADRRLVAAQWAGAMRVRVTFDDGAVKTVDFAPMLSGRGGVFSEIGSSEEAFSKFHFEPEFGTIAWPNGADTAPENFEMLPDVG